MGFIKHRRPVLAPDPTDGTMGVITTDNTIANVSIEWHEDAV